MPETLIKSEGAANDGDVLGARDEWTQEQQEALELGLKVLSNLLLRARESRGAGRDACFC